MKKIIGIQIDPADNVVTVVEQTEPGDTIEYRTPGSHARLESLDAVPFGHKVAISDVRPGEEIVKYNQTIGTASELIGKGRHVHVHNVRSAVQGEESGN